MPKNAQPQATQEDELAGLKGTLALGGGAYAGVKAKPLITGRTRLYHGTDRETAQKIRAEGLKPSGMAGRRGVTDVLPDDIGKPSKNMAFMTPHRAEAREYSHQAEHLKRFFADKPNATREDIFHELSRMRADPRLAANVGNPLYGRKNTVVADVPLWKQEVASKLRTNPEARGSFEEFRRATGGLLDLRPHEQVKAQHQSFLKSKAFEGGLGTEYIHGSPNYQKLSLKELGQYARAKPGRFAGGVALGATAVGGGIYGAKKLMEHRRNVKAHEYKPDPMEAKVAMVKFAAFGDELVKIAEADGEKKRSVAGRAVAAGAGTALAGGAATRHVVLKKWDKASSKLFNTYADHSKRREQEHDAAIKARRDWYHKPYPKEDVSVPVAHEAKALKRLGRTTDAYDKVRKGLNKRLTRGAKAGIAATGVAALGAATAAGIHAHKKNKQDAQQKEVTAKVNDWVKDTLKTVGKEAGTEGKRLVRSAVRNTTAGASMYVGAKAAQRAGKGEKEKVSKAQEKDVDLNFFERHPKSVLTAAALATAAGVGGHAGYKRLTDVSKAIPGKPGSAVNKLGIKLRARRRLKLTKEPFHESGNLKGFKDGKRGKIRDVQIVNAGRAGEADLADAAVRKAKGQEVYLKHRHSAHAEQTNGGKVKIKMRTKRPGEDF